MPEEKQNKTFKQRKSFGVSFIHVISPTVSFIHVISLTVSLQLPAHSADVDNMVEQDMSGKGEVGDMEKGHEGGVIDLSRCKADPVMLKISLVGVVNKLTIKIRCSRCMTFLLSVLVLSLAVPGTNGQGFALEKTNQALPEQCFAGLFRLKLNGCPKRGKFDHWQQRNQICCADYPGLFHCQEPKIPGGTLIFAACLPEQTVPPGKIGRLIKNETGFPELDLTTDCDHGTYRSERINSSFIRYPRCEEKTRQNPDEEKVCDGGITADQLFFCKEGYQSHCSQGRNSSHDFCECTKLNCAEGSRPFRNMTGSCIAGNFRVTYGCRFGSGENGTEIPPGLTDATNTTTTTTTTTTNTNTEQGGNSGIAIWIVIGMIVAVLFVIAIVIAIYCLCRYCNDKGSYNCPDEKALLN
ncbi:hypothetical protein ACOMHN_012428 [Nucella lapillus]